MIVRSARRRLRLGDGGLTAVIVALMMSALLMFSAIAIDGGAAYASHRQTQNAADTGAMAGVRVLEQLKFSPVCTAFVVTQCTTFTSSSAIRSEVLREAQATGADQASTGVSCYLLDGSQNRLGSELCTSGALPTAANLSSASGIEVQTVRTKRTYFASIAGFDQTQAGGTAKAFIFNFNGGTGSPFLICGIRSQMPAGYSNPLSWAYDLASPNGSGGYTLVDGAAGRYYQIQGSQNPSCGAGSNTFKGLGSGESIKALPYNSGIVTGNAFVNNVQLTIAGLKPCAAGAATFDGCGMLIPIVDSATGSGSGTLMHVVTWLAWQVWGSGNSYSFLGSNTDALATSCGNPVTPGGSMKYCGKLLGAAAISGGAGSGPGVAGQPHVLRLSS